MKVKVVLYQQQAEGAPFNVLSSPVYGEVNSVSEIKPLIMDVLNQSSMYVSQDLNTMVGSIDITRILDIINIQNYLANQNLVLVVSTSTDEFDFEGKTGYFVEVLTPSLESGLSDSTIYYSENQDYDEVAMISDIINKYALGDPNIVPSSTIRNLLNMISDMQSKGMPVYNMYISQLENELLKYGFSMYYVYLQ